MILHSTRLMGCLLGIAGITASWPAEPWKAGTLDAVDAAILEAVRQQQCAGGVIWIEGRDRAYHRAYGLRARVPEREPMTEDAIFDVASLTKVVACTPAVMHLVEQGILSLDQPVSTFISEFAGDGRERVTVHHLLTHTSGLPAGIPASGDWHGATAAIQKACSLPLEGQPGEAFKYSDVNFILLGEMVQRISRTPLDQFVQREFFVPLRMSDTGYLPPADKRRRIAPTAVVDGQPLRGLVHDPVARRMGGVAGHAGLFATAADLARYARMLLNLGELDGVRVLQAETVRRMTQVQTPPGWSVQRGFGWDIDSPYSSPRGEIFGPGSYGHTGWTGTSLWLDPSSMSFVLFLSNRNHPTEQGSVVSLRRNLGTLAAEALGLERAMGGPGAAQTNQSNPTP